ncbi:DUF6090 family protein [Algoriphagus boritolerans]|uniref:Uncharacterized protein n=1 Tax=Algoriphagus boritolerans DSM 17298 = JCM 18970 TaxID=1120964 RepID=A0A1H5VC79_9BACT|nr:DUF6090 family protein [Algoriphagus boritolerans]SEF84840.1 hypothetical protein SAMN03080598_01645 [Algoriphagus boritolerans DSM 17298 = JCM 18970]
MLKLFRKIRQRLLEQNKVTQYLTYAIGEIFLVVVGILIALQFNNWNENQKKLKIKQRYVENLIVDITKDTIQLNQQLEVNYGYKQNIDSTFTFINLLTPNLDTLLFHIKNTSNNGLRVMNTYNDNTFNILISSGNIDLFSNEFTNDLMELSRLQKAEKNVSELNSVYFLEIQNTYQSEYYNPLHLKNPQLKNILWENKKAKHAISQFINMKQQQLHTVNRYLELTTIVLKKSEEILEQLKNSKNL